MNKRFIRVLSLVLCVLMCATMLPLTALAADSTREKSTVRFAVSNGAPKITTQPKSKSVKQGASVTFQVKASGSNLKYQWYYRKSSSASWTKYAGKTSAKLTFTAGKVNGYQYRCKVSNASGSVYSKAVTLKVNYVKYRALLIGQTYASCSGLSTLVGDVDAAYMKLMLDKVKGPKNSKYSVTTKVDASWSGIKSAISKIASAADSNDVTLFYFSGHGVSSEASGDYAGAMCTVEGSSYDLMTMPELASWLKKIPGKVVVMIDSCGSGAAIYKNGIPVNNDAELDLFNQSVIRAFAAADEVMEADDGLTVNLGDFRKSKFYVLTASKHQENSNVVQLSDGTKVSLFTFLAAAGVYTGDANTSGDKYITLNELYKFVKANEMADTFGQHVQVYPTSSSYKLFKTA